MQDVENIKDTEDIKGAESIKGAEDIGNMKNTRNIENYREMEIDRIKYSGIIKFIATIVLTCSICGFIGMLSLSAVYTEIGKDDGIYEYAYDCITQNYVHAVLTTLVESHEEKKKAIDNLLDGSGLSVAVFESDTNDIDKVDVSDEKKYVYGNPKDLIKDYKYFYWAPKGTSYSYNINSLLEVLLQRTYSYETNIVDEDEENQKTVYYIVLVDGPFEGSIISKDNMFIQTKQLVNGISFWGKNAMIYEVISFILMIISGSYMVSAVGHKPGYKEIYLRFVDRVPFEIYSVAIFTVEAIVIYMLYLLIWEGIVTDFVQLIILGLQIAFVIAFLGVAYIGTFITRIKAKKFWRYTLLYYMFAPLRKIVWYRREDKSLFRTVTWRMILCIFVLFVTFIFCWMEAQMLYTGFPIVLWVLVVLALVPAGIYMLTFQMNEIKQGVDRLASGDVDHPIKVEKLNGSFKTHAEKLNEIGNGIELAVNEKMKSERLKTELITNVSHDIKTPLTSIINYVDLMKKESIDNQTVLEYMEVLDRQSSRLKKLIEDLIEASKASTGNLAVNFEECDIAVILSQAVGEFEDKMTARELTAVVSYPEYSISVKADGRHLWRVFDNLLNNICKYAQPGTRVYIDVAQRGSIVEIIFKNISSSQLNISSDELMERFVRGDSSRNTEGSGLGLSIANSLMELMNGKMTLDVDGDLFKVTLAFDAE